MEGFNSTTIRVSGGFSVGKNAKYRRQGEWQFSVGNMHMNGTSQQSVFISTNKLNKLKLSFLVVGFFFLLHGRHILLT
jgi:hypothetical protein